MTMTPDQSPSLLDFMEVPDVVAYAGEKREGLSELGSEPLIAAMKTVYDPEIPVDIYELGLIYRLEAKPDGDVEVDMTLTAPACPVAGELPQWVADAVATVEGTGLVTVQLVFEPPWTPERMSDEARLALDMF
ncbi:MAG: SUF system Fe-S cluster assembly protein [Minwuia thermotolerans]|nr:SUF system Fe-S cluster assembly protein [Minwuia sp.]GJL86434.1 MAG: SUF system Fe-S cluster assembly protein [Minwuia thermotolerans]